MTNQKIPRTIPDLVEALQRQVKLLREFSKRAFAEGDLDYCGEVANKLRLLVIQSKSNVPLLLRLMEEFGIQPPVRLSGPPVEVPPGHPKPGDEIPLGRYLELPSGMVRVPSGELAEMSKLEFIKGWAEQHGGAHEDWAQTDALRVFRDFSVFIGGQQVAVRELRITANVVLKIAEEFLRQLPPELVAKKESERTGGKEV